MSGMIRSCCGTPANPRQLPLISPTAAAGRDHQTGYIIYDQKRGRAVAQLGPDGVIQDDGDPVAVAELKALMQRDIESDDTELLRHSV